MHKNRTQHDSLLSETEESRRRRSQVIDNVVVKLIFWETLDRDREPSIDRKCMLSRQEIFCRN